MLSDYAEPLSDGKDEAKFGKGTSTGTLPPPRPQQIDWKLAIRSASLVAFIAAVLGVVGQRIPNLSVFSFVWLISASLTTMAVYQRRRPLASMNIRIGAKIGILVGVVLVFALGAAMSIGTLVSRFVLHSMAESDKQTAQVLSGIKIQLDQLAATRPVPPGVYAMLGSSEAGSVLNLLGLGLGMATILAVSVFGGAVAGLLRSRRSIAA